MDDRRTRTTALARGTAPAEIRRDRDGLLGHLAVIDVEGWDSPSATALLTYLRSHVVRPLAVDVGLRGACAAHAEATAWEAVWLQLLEPSLRSAHSPWGVLWQTARRAMLGEILADRWGVSPRRAWELDAAERAGGIRRPLSLEPLLTNGWEPPAEGSAGMHDGPLTTAVHLAAQALGEAGWPAELAARIVQETAEMDGPVGAGTTAVGWRPLAIRLELPPWQARRLVLIAIHAYAAAFHGADLSAPDPVAADRGVGALVRHARAWQRLHHALSDFAILAPPMTSIRDDATAAVRLLQELAPMQHPPTPAPFAPTERHVAAVLNGAVQVIADIAVQEGTTFDRLARTGLLFMPARSLPRDLVSERPDLATAHLERRIVHAPETVTGITARLYAEVAAHPIGVSTAAPARRSATASTEARAISMA